MLTLGIETSCDETAIAVINEKEEILANIVTSSIPLHKKFGGIIPEIACRFHVEYIGHCLEEALKKAGISLKDIDLIAVTYGPGLVGALLVGISFAKSLSWSLKRPLIGVNHLKAHIYAALMEHKIIKFPVIGLIISGGHTCLVYVLDIEHFQLLGQTRDDACGEAFDKVAKILGLGYPGGPMVEKRARLGKRQKVKFPRTYLDTQSLDFSFSGVKTAVLYYIRDNFKNNPNRQEVNDICASFQESVIEVLADKALAACQKRKIHRLVVGGGVSANSRLREYFLQRSSLGKVEVYFPCLNLSLDNAVMVAGLGQKLYKKGKVSKFNLTAEPNLGIK